MNREPTPRQQSQILRMAGAIVAARQTARGRLEQTTMLEAQQSALEAELREVVSRLQDYRNGGLQAALYRDPQVREQATAAAESEAARLRARIEAMRDERFRLGRETNAIEGEDLAQEHLVRRLCDAVGINADDLLRPRGRIEVSA
jgi:hypothetical protein